MRGFGRWKDNRWGRWAAYASLGILPLCVVLLLFWIKAVRGPYWLALNFDPAYAYLLNSLLMVNGQTPTMVEHPGTPLEVLGAGVIGVIHLFRGTPSVTQDVLEHPELYLSGIHATLSLFYGLVLFVVGVLTLRTTKSVAIALLMQAPPLLACRMLPLEARIMPESLLMSLGALLSAVVLSYLWNPPPERDRKRDRRYAVLFGILVGLGVATKLSFVPLAVMPLVLLPRMRSRIWYVSTSLVAFLVAVLPALPRAGYFFSWHLHWVTHTGRYGRGETGVLSSSDLQPLRTVLARTGFLWILFIIVVVVLVVLWFARRKRPISEHVRPIRTGLGAFALVVLLQLLMLLKQPRYHYVVPVLCCLALGVVFLFELMRHWTGWRRFLRLGLAAVFVVCAVGECVKTFRHWRKAFPRITDRYMAVHDAMERRFPNAIKIYLYRASNQAYALAEMRRYTGPAFDNELRRLYPKRYLWDLFGEQYTHFGRTMTWEEIVAENPRVFFQGEPLCRHPHLPTSVPTDLVLEAILPEKLETIYRPTVVPPESDPPAATVEETLSSL